jgi:ribulose kinase
MLGTAMLAAVAAGAYLSIPDAIIGMSPRAEPVQPDSSTRAFHAAKYAVFHRMYEHQQEYRRLMAV